MIGQESKRGIGSPKCRRYRIRPKAQSQGRVPTSTDIPISLLAAGKRRLNFHGLTRAPPGVRLDNLP